MRVVSLLGGNPCGVWCSDLRAPRPSCWSGAGRYFRPPWVPIFRELPPFLGVETAAALLCGPQAAPADFTRPMFTPLGLVPVISFLALGANVSTIPVLVAPRRSLPGRLVRVPGAASLMMGCSLPGELDLALPFAGVSPNVREMNPAGDRRSALMPVKAATSVPCPLVCPPA